MRKIKMKHLMLLITVALIMGVSAVVANDIPGTVEVIEPTFQWRYVVVPSAVDPQTQFQITFTLSHSGGIWSKLNMMFIHLWSDTVLETDPEDPSTHLSIRFIEKGLGESPWDTELGGNWFDQVNADPDVCGDISLSATSYDFMLLATLDPIAEAGLWHYKFFTVGKIPADDQEYQGTFNVNNYLDVQIVESSFSFGDVQKGMIDIQVMDPTSGYLTVNIVSNFLVQIQASSTDPTSGINSFSVSNIKCWDADNVAAALVLSNTLQDVNTVSYKGSNSAHVYLWISVPTDQVIGTYTFTLSLVLVAAA